MASSRKPPIVQPSIGKNIIINPNQRLNPILDCIRNAGKEFGDIVPDFQVGRTTCILFLSLKYHRLHPEYIHSRIEKLGHSYSLRILLIMCDVSEHQQPIRELTKVCLVNNITIIIAWSTEEAGQYITTFKQFEYKPPDLIKERVDKDHDAILRTALTSINKVNKTDVETLRSSLGSFAGIARAPADRLQTLPGFGPVKIRRIKDAFDRPFRNRDTNALSSVGSQIPCGSANGVMSMLNGENLLEVAGPTASGSKAVSSDSPSAEGRVKGKAKESAPLSGRSPAWDMALDLDSPLPTASSGPPSRTARDPSPVWDIEFDLNEDDLSTDVDPRLASKRRFGQAGSPLGSDE